MALQLVIDPEVSLFKGSSIQLLVSVSRRGRKLLTFDWGGEDVVD